MLKIKNTSDPRGYLNHCKNCNECFVAEKYSSYCDDCSELPEVQEYVELLKSAWSKRMSSIGSNLNLEKLEKEIETMLALETKESLMEFLNEERSKMDEQLKETLIGIYSCYQDEDLISMAWYFNELEERYPELREAFSKEDWNA